MTAQLEASDSGARPTPHGWKARALHWGFIVVLVYAVSKQLDEVDELEDALLLRNEMIFAVLFLLLLGVRFLFMQRTRPTALAEATPQWERWLARSVHLGLYASVAMMAVSGLMIGGLYSAEIKVGLLMDIALALHEFFVWCSGVLITGHVIAALYHRMQGDGIWSSMVPLWRERPRT